MRELEPGQSLKLTLISEFAARHERCIATDGEYTDKEMVQILSDAMKGAYEEDLQWLGVALDEAYEAGRVSRDFGVGDKATAPEVPTPGKKDELFDRVKAWIEDELVDGDLVTARLIASQCNISYGRASSLIEDLEAAGVISAPDPITHTRKAI